MVNIETLEKNLKGLYESWEEIQFESKIPADKKMNLLAKLEEEIYLTKNALEKMKNFKGDK